ncbi:MAG: hypothetical protein JO021_20955 [Alphaproteobacteria bacterium]|nr:hypothetical protein [Alphaproteobacteria bacterium]
MTQPSRVDRLGDAPSALPAKTDDSSPSLASLAIRLAAWRRRAKQTRAFRGFDQHQLRDLGLNHFDQW